jgi:hypothetical protein
MAPAHVDFLTPHPANAHLADVTIYRPGAVVALALLVGPVACAVAGSITTSLTGAIPIWLPVALLLWLPALALAWALLKSVRVSPETLACWRPLSPGHSLRFAEIERIEQRGPRIVITSRYGKTLSFTPLFLHRGDHLRRSLLLQAPLFALPGDLRAEASALENGAAAATPENGVEGILNMRTPVRWSALPLGAAAVMVAAAVATLTIWGLAWPLDVALGAPLLALAAGMGFIGLWAAQEIFVSEKGALIHYRLLRRKRDIFWSHARLIEVAPGDLALRFRSGRDLLCAGPSLFARDDAARLRDYLQQYATSPIQPMRARRTPDSFSLW